MRTTLQERKIGHRTTRAGEARTPALADRKSASLDLRAFVVLPENRSAVRAMSGLARSILRGKRPRVNLLVLHGQPGTGKTRLTHSVLGALAVASRTATGRSIPARELARADAELGFDDPDLTTCDFLVLEDIQHLPKSATSALCELIDRRQSRRLALVVTASAGPARLPNLPRRLTSRLAAGLVVQLEPLGKRSRRAIIESSVRSAKLAPDALDWLAEQRGGLPPAPAYYRTSRRRQRRIARSTGMPSSKSWPEPGNRHHVKRASGHHQACASHSISLERTAREKPVGPRARAATGRDVSCIRWAISRCRGSRAFDRDHDRPARVPQGETMKKDAMLDAMVLQLKKTE